MHVALSGYNQNSKKQFMSWLRQSDPKLYFTVIKQARLKRRSKAYTLSGLDDNLSGWWDDIKGTLTSVLKTGLQIKQQRDIYKLQLQRADRGLPPLKTDELAPVIRTEIEIGKNTRNQLFSEVGSGLKKFMIPAAIGIGALFFFMRR